MNRGKLSHINQNCGPILVTGHTGFKGTWLTMLLEYYGVEVVGLSLPAEPESLFARTKRLGKVEEDFFDIRDENKVNRFIGRIKPRVIMHLAAQSLVLDSYKHPKHTFDTNVGGLINILEVFVQSDNAEVMLVSTTDKVYENNGAGRSFEENDCLRGKDPYSASKVAAENAIFAWRELIKSDSQKKLLTARAGNVIGGGDFSKNRLIPDLVRAFSTNSKVEIRNPRSTRPWQHVLDPIIGYLSMIDNALSGNKLEILNFGPTEESLSVQEVVEIAAGKWQSNSKITYREDSSELEARSLELNSSLARKALGWKPLWNQQEAVIESMSWWKDVLINGIDAHERCNSDLNKTLNLDKLI
jgi:CDP-glucose 4,6-dehydratase